MPIKAHLFPIVLVIAITLLVWYDSFNNSFILDDYSFVVENPSIRKLDIRSIISFFLDKDTTAASGHLAGDVWRPLTMTSFSIDYKFWKLKPRYYHIENTILHIVNAILVYLIAVLISDNSLMALAASLVFSIHPIQTEAVTWISGRSNVLFLLFYLLAFIFHIRNRDAARRASYYSLSLISFILSLLSKEMAITLPLVLISYDMHFSPKKDLRYYVNYYAPFFLIGAFWLLARLSVLGRVAQRAAWWGEGIFYNSLTMLKALLGYIRLLFFPVNLRVGYVIDISRSILDEDVLIALAALSLIAILYYFKFRRERRVSFYISWFFITLVPVLNIVPLKVIMAERFLYLPSIAFAYLLGALFSKRPILISILIFYGAGTISRNIEWRDELIFYRKEVSRSPSNAKFHYNLGLAYSEEAEKNSASGDISDSYYALAIDQFKDAVRLRPDFQSAYINLGDIYNERGLYDIALENFKKAALIKEDHIAYDNSGVAYYNKGMYDKAIGAYKRSLSLKPDHANAYVNLGNAYFMKGEYTKARLAWSAAAKLGGAGRETMENISDLERLGY